MDTDKEIKAWWRPVSSLTRLAMFADEREQVAQAPSLSQEQWKAGQSRPPLSFPLGTKEAALVLTLLIVISAATLPWWGIHAPIALVLTQAAWAPPLGCGIEAWLSRSGASGAKATLKAMFATGAQSWLMMMAVFVALPMLIERPATALRRRLRRNRLDFVVVAGPFQRFSQRLEEWGVGYGRRVDIELEKDLSALTPAGAWRLARHKLLLGSPEGAARAWLARPFNPSWRVRRDKDDQGRDTPLRGMRMPFVEAVESAIGQSRDPQVLELAALAMRSRMETQELEKSALAAPPKARARL